MSDNCQTNGKAYHILADFLQACFREPNAEKALSLLTEDFYAVGMGSPTSVRSREEFSARLNAWTAEHAAIADCQISGYSEKEPSPGVVLGTCRVTVTGELADGHAVFLDRYLTSGFAAGDSGYRITHFYSSDASALPTERVQSPLHFADSAAGAQWTALQISLAQLLKEALPGGVLGLYAETGAPLYAIGDGLLSHLGYTYEAFLSASQGRILQIIHPGDRTAVMQAVLDALRSRQDFKVRYRIRKQDGLYVWVCHRARPFFTSGGRAVIAGTVIDISETVHLQERLERESTLDSLTQAYNRREAQRLIEHSLSLFGSGALLLFDIDQFSAFHDAHGPTEGDEVLVRLSHILKENVRSDDIVARSGNDEFIVYLHNIWRREDIALQARRLHHAFQESCRDKQLPELTLSVGGVLASRGQAFHTLYDAAANMLQRSKRAASGRDKIQIC